MHAVINRNGIHQKLAPSFIPTKKVLSHSKDSVMAIRTGLSVTVVGYLIYLDRNEEQMTAKLRIQKTAALDPAHKPDEIEHAAIKTAALLLAQRARRVLGIAWKVAELGDIK